MSHRLLSGLLTAFIVVLSGATPAPGQQETNELKLEDLFPEKSFFGKTARAMAWSFDDRYVAYLWNTYEDKGYDLWLYDTRRQAGRRLTSIEMMAGFDREAAAILERYREEKAEEERRKGLSEEERKKLEDEDKRRKEEEEEKEREEGDQERETDYAGISSFTWANRSNELLLEYRGDIFRFDVGDELPIRLTRTQEDESGLKYSNDDSGFYFQRGNHAFHARFDSPVVRQLNPELPNNMSMRGYYLSPDETKILITTGRDTGKNREVTYITYRDRFAKARTVNRGVADDPFRNEAYLFVYDLNDDPGTNPDHDGKPWQVYFWPEGEEYGQTSIHGEPWSHDSQRVVFATWRPGEKELQVIVADVKNRTIKTVFRDEHNSGPDTPALTRPFFTPDGNRIVALLEKSGYRHAWVVDPLTLGATQLTRGAFEVYPRELSEDGSRLYANSDSQNPARMDLYAVDMTDGEMTRITTRDGYYGNYEFSHDHRHAAVNFRSWTSLSELYLVDALDPGNEVPVTDSHPETFGVLNRLTPELFTYTNRHGHTIHGYLFHPPGWKRSDRRPLMIYTYGGPLATTKNVTDGSLSSAGYLFNMYLAYRHGYVTATIDTRGMSGYGGHFEGANWEQPGKPQSEDLVDGVTYLIENHGVDSEKVGINGWSFGGFQTQYCLYAEPDVFKLGIAGAGPTEWQNYNTWYANIFIGDAPLGGPDELDQYSLTKLARNLKSPLLLLHGMEDTNVLFQDTIHVYRELLKAGKGPLVELVIDPTGGHGLGGDIKTRDRYEIYEAFLMKHWGSHRN
jgi:dipeptidyl aminopeptidase/acylaminoacyl peptidase